MEEARSDGDGARLEAGENICHFDQVMDVWFA